MKLFKAADCLTKLNELFDRTTADFAFASALCDVMSELETQGNKYAKLKNTILKEYYTLQEDGNYKITDIKKMDEVEKKTTELNELSFTTQKVTVNKPDMVSPRELYCLREFFDFA